MLLCLSGLPLLFSTSESQQVSFLFLACGSQSSQDLLLLQVGDHCLEDGQKIVVTVTNATAGTLSGFSVLPTA